MNEQLLEIIMRALQLRNHYQTIDNAESFKAELILKYKKNLLEKILSCIWMDHTSLNLRLEQLLAENWELVKNTTLCYTALPEDDLTLLLCDMATTLVKNEGSALSLLMPGIAVETSNDSYPNLSDIEIKQVLKTHITSQCGAYLLPISLLLELKVESGNNVRIFNPYYNYELGEQSADIDQHTFHRLFEHSSITRALKEARLLYHNFLMSSTSLYFRLIRLTESFYLNGVEGIGSEFEAGQGVFDEIVSFIDYFKKLDGDQKEKIPDNVREQIETIIGLASDSDFNLAAGVDTCISVRRKHLEVAMHGHDALLMQIDLTQAARDKGLGDYDKIFKDTQERLRENLLNNYTGRDQLPLSIRHIQTFNIALVVKTLEDLNDLMLFETRELSSILPDNSKFCEMIVGQLNSIEALTVFLKELPNDKFSMILNKIISVINTIEKLAYFLSHLDSVKFTIFAQQFFNQSKPIFYKLFKYLSSEQCCLLLQKLTNIDVNFYCPMGDTLLHTMIKRQFTEAVHKLLAFDTIRVNERNSHGITPLFLTCCMGNFEATALLLGRDNIELNAENNERSTPLFMACQEGHADVIGLLLADTRIDVNKTGMLNTSPLYMAAQNGHKRAVEILLGYPGIDINKANATGRTPLMMASQEGHADVVALLLEKDNIEVNAKNNDGLTSLFLACQNGRADVVELLLKHKSIDINKANATGRTPLMMAAQEGHADVVALLLEKDNIEVNAKDNKGLTSLFLACEDRRVDVVKLLLAHKVDVNQAEKDGFTPLFIACQEGHADVVTLLLKYRGININQASNDGFTPLFISCQNGHTDIVTLLLTHESINIDKVPEKDNAAVLTVACQNGHTEVVKLLLQYRGIDINQASNDGFTPLFRACQKGHIDVVTLLLTYEGININQASNNGFTPLFMACQNDHVSVVKLLIEHKNIDINKVSGVGGAAPLFIACQQNCAKVVRLLLTHKDIDVNQALNNGVTPLFIASQSGYIDIVEVLNKHKESKPWGSTYRVINSEQLHNGLPKNGSSDSSLVERGCEVFVNPDYKDYTGELGARDNELFFQGNTSSTSRTLGSLLGKRSNKDESPAEDGSDISSYKKPKR